MRVYPSLQQLCEMRCWACGEWPGCLPVSPSLSPPCVVAQISHDGSVRHAWLLGEHLDVDVIEAELSRAYSAVSLVQTLSPMPSPAAAAAAAAAPSPLPVELPSPPARKTTSIANQVVALLRGLPPRGAGAGRAPLPPALLLKQAVAMTKVVAMLSALCASRPQLQDRDSEEGACACGSSPAGDLRGWGSRSQPQVAAAAAPAPVWKLNIYCRKDDLSRACAALRDERTQI